VHLVADVGVGLGLGRVVAGVVLLDEAQGGQRGHQVWVQGREVGVQGAGGRGRHQPFGGRVVQVLQDNVDADEGPRPAEAVEEVGGHCLLGLFFTRSLARARGLVGCLFLSLRS